MSYELALSVNGIGKQFSDAHLYPHRALRERLDKFLRRPLGRDTSEAFWALRDVSFDVRRGEVFGIVGGNGAGKSVLLRILSRIIKPTTGVAEIYGKASAILQLGAGVHSELTGRANIYQSGTVLRLTKKAIEKKFDEIVAFAGLGDFIDRPVKTYSAGMQLRLSFAIMVQLETEILLIDEALAVGDAAFSAKCMDRMRRLVAAGQTVVIVSHDLNFMKAFCNRIMVLHRGKLKGIGSPAEMLPVLLSTL